MKNATCIKLVEGIHITATEKRSIRQMLDAGYQTARNRTNTKSYEMLGNSDANRYMVRIGTKAVWTIGDIARWQYSTIIIESTK